MVAAESLPSVIAYWKELVGAGWQGLASFREEHAGALLSFNGSSWLPVAVGAGIGILSTSFGNRRRSASQFAAGGLVGSMLGCGAAAAWASRRVIGPAAHVAARRVNAVRDAHWLESHPIDYA